MLGKNLEVTYVVKEVRTSICNNLHMTKRRKTNKTNRELTVTKRSKTNKTNKELQVTKTPK